MQPAGMRRGAVLTIEGKWGGRVKEREAEGDGRVVVGQDTLQVGSKGAVFRISGILGRELLDQMLHYEFNGRDLIILLVIDLDMNANTITLCGSVSLLDCRMHDNLGYHGRGIILLPRGSL